MEKPQGYSSNRALQSTASSSHSILLPRFGHQVSTFPYLLLQTALNVT
jgi:hypothetical protein